MKAYGTSIGGDRRRTRRDLLRQYVKLQRDLVDGDPADPSYQAVIHAFRQLGYLLINSGFEDDLDRLLRIRVLYGGRATPSHRSGRHVPEELYVMERRPV